MVAAGTVLAAVGGWRYARASAPVSGPIVLVSIDALRADRLPLYGATSLATPALDALGLDGIVFERFYSHVPQSLPAHAAIFSSRLPFETGVRDSVGFKVKDSERTLAEILSDRDYETGAIVSSYALRRGTGIGQGFEFFDDKLDAGDGDVDETSVGVIARDGEASERIAETWLQSIGTPRAFLFLHLTNAHASDAAMAHPDDPDSYNAAVEHADEVVGRLVKYLKGHQLYDQSTIIVTSAFGQGLGDHVETAHGLLVYDDVVRVPLIVKQAAGEGAGRRVTDLAQHIDLMPTILDLAKAPAPDNLRGRSLTPLLAGARRFPARFAYSESLLGHYHFGLAPVFAITDGRHHLIRTNEQELYDLETDPEEQHNLADDQPELVAELNSALDRMLNSKPIDKPSSASEEELQRLEALGYGTADSFNRPTSDGPLAEPRGWAPVVNAYREAVGHDVRRDWPAAIRIFRALTKEHPASSLFWNRLADVAERADRFDVATEARARVITLNPESPEALVGAAFTGLKARRLDDAARQARQALALTGPSGALAARAFEVLTRVALVRRDAVDARQQAALASSLDPARSLRSFVEARLLLDQRRYEDALAAAEEGIADLDRAGGPPIAGLHLVAAEALLRLERPLEAEAHFLEELRAFPLNVRARTELAALYHNIDRVDEADRALSDLIRIAPTPDAFVQAARTWTSFGNPRQAAAVREQARRLFAIPAQPDTAAVHE
jgi:tetratricopeptide (TPR) repeat protein